MTISKEIINEIKNRTDIALVIGDYVPSLKRSGKNWVGLCPFHKEKNPSFVVSTDYGIYKCFGCGEKGDVINFLEKVEGYSFIEAVNFLAKKIGIEINIEQKENQSYIKKDEIIQFNNKLIKLFQFFLFKKEESTKQLEYISKRGLTNELIDLFKIGYAPKGYGRLERFLKNKGYNEDFLIMSGLFSKGENGLKCLFFDRIMFPIINYKGECIGFGGRALDDNIKPKYINSPETIVYKKGANLFGLNLTKNYIQQEKKAFIVEGYMDVISCFKNGLKNVCAPCGTAITKEQIKLISRYANEVVLLLDGDEAGIKGAAKALFELANIENIKTSVLVLPDGMDPDDYFKNYTYEDFKLYEKQTISNIDFLIFFITKNNDIKDYKNLINALNFLFEYINLWDNELIRDNFIEKISIELNLDKSSIIKQFKNFINKHKINNNNEFIDNKKEKNETLNIRTRREIDLILFLSKINDYKSLIKKCDLKEEHFFNEEVKKLFNELITFNSDIKKNLINFVTDENIKNYIESRLFDDDFKLKEEILYNNIIDRIIEIRKYYYNFLNEEIKDKIKLAKLYKDELLINELLEEKTLIMNEIIKIDKLQELKNNGKY